jgi:hypothetical protein
MGRVVSGSQVFPKKLGLKFIGHTERHLPLCKYKGSSHSKHVFVSFGSHLEQPASQPLHSKASSSGAVPVGQVS